MADKDSLGSPNMKQCYYNVIGKGPVANVETCPLSVQVQETWSSKGCHQGTQYIKYTIYIIRHAIVFIVAEYSCLEYTSDIVTITDTLTTNILLSIEEQVDYAP